MEAGEARVAQRLCRGLASPPPSASQSRPAALAVWHCWTESKKESHTVKEVFQTDFVCVCVPLMALLDRIRERVTHSQRGLSNRFLVLPLMALLDRIQERVTPS